jgi:GrpB-like predicted nucleotidyltransferase (UPF0157 family)
MPGTERVGSTSAPAAVPRPAPQIADVPRAHRQLKRELAGRDRRDMSEHADAKSDLIAEILAAAGA